MVIAEKDGAGRLQLMSALLQIEPEKDADGPQPERSGDSRRQMAQI
jgi:hypothetical protein